MQMKLALQKMELSTMTFEETMADEREYDEVKSQRMIDLFITETSELKEVKD
jgi:hypothetical protein